MRALNQGKIPILLVFILAQAFYICTLAPTVLWGDDAMYQRRAAEFDVRNDNPWDHPVWVLPAALFARIPVGDPAFRTNLFTSVCAALAVAFTFGLVRRHTSSVGAGILGAGALGVSHCFWTHAVRTEVYSLNLFALALGLFLITHPDWGGGVAAAGLALGAAVANHVMMLIVLPAFLIIGIDRVVRREIRFTEGIGGLLVFALSLSAARLLLPPTYSLDVRAIHFLPKPEAIPGAIKTFLVYLLLQFPTPPCSLRLSEWAQIEAAGPSGSHSSRCSCSISSSPSGMTFPTSTCSTI